MRVLMLSAILLLNHSGLAIAVDRGFSWYQCYGGILIDEGRCCVATADGGYVLIGDTHSFGNGVSDIWAIRTDAYGAILWESTFGGDLEDYGASILGTADGGYIIAGCTYSFGAGNGDGWLLKTDSSGNIEWDTTFGTQNDDWFREADKTADGGYILAGASGVFGDDMNFYLVRVDSTGSLIWERSIGGNADDGAFSVQQTADAGYIIAGSTESYGAGWADGWIVKTDSTGESEWDLILGDISFDRFTSIRQTADGQFVATGYSYSSTSDDRYLWLVGITDTGALKWEKLFEGEGSAAGMSLQSLDDGGCIVVGSTQPAPGFENSIWLVRTDSLGDIEWDLTLQSDYPTLGEHVTQSPDTGYAVVGTQLVTNEDRDIILAKAEKPTGIDEEDYSPSHGIGLNIEPNPFYSACIVEINHPDSHRIQVSIFDISGREIKSLSGGLTSAGSHSMTWDGTDAHGEELSSGTYIILAASEGDFAVERVVKL